MTVGRGDARLRRFEIALGDDAEDLLNFCAIDGAFAEHHLEAVVFGGIVAAGDHDSAVEPRCSTE